MTLNNNRAPLLSNIKHCASFHCHMWIQTGVTVWKRLNGVMTSVTLTFDPWPWPLAWTLCRPMVITPEKFVMIRWWEHSEKGVTDGRTDRQTDRKKCSISCLVAAKNYFENVVCKKWRPFVPTSMRGVASVAEWKHHNKMCVCTKASHLLLCQGLIYW